MRATTIAGIVAAALIAFGAVAVAMLTNHTDSASLQLVGMILGFCSIIISGLIGFEHVAGKVQDVHLSLNSRLDELNKRTADAAYARGQGVKADPGEPNQS